MRKAVLFTLICAVCFAGCDKIGNPFEKIAAAENPAADEEQFPGAEKLGEEIRYYNDYLGVSCAVPQSWWLYEVNTDNFSESAGGITDDVSMDINFGDYENYSYSNVWLLSFGNLEKSTQDNHLGFNIEAEAIEGINDIAGFMEYHETFMLEPTEEEEYGLLASEQITIKGKAFELRDYSVTREEDDYRIMTLTCGVKNGYFLNIMVDYWPENTRAKQAVIDTVTRVIDFY